MRFRSRHVPCLVLVVATVFGGWPTLPACACAPVAKSATPGCCCVQPATAAEPACACCQPHAAKPVPAGRGHCDCKAAPADPSPTIPPAPPAAADEAAAAVFLADVLDPTRPVTAQISFTPVGRPPAVVPDLVISLARLTC